MVINFETRVCFIVVKNLATEYFIIATVILLHLCSVQTIIPVTLVSDLVFACHCHNWLDLDILSMMYCCYGIQSRNRNLGFFLNPFLILIVLIIWDHKILFKSLVSNSRWTSHTVSTSILADISHLACVVIAAKPMHQLQIHQIVHN